MESKMHAVKAEAIRSSNSIYLNGTYLQKNKDWHAEDSPWKAEQIRKMLSRNKFVPDTVCEVGCGAGEIIRQLHLMMPNTRFYGYEISPQAFEICQRKEADNLNYFHKDITNEETNYDCLLCIDVFEHVDDYLGFLRALKNKAKLKVFHIPLDMNIWSLLRGNMIRERLTVGHLHYYSKETALATLSDCGYEIIDWFYTTSLIDRQSYSFRNRIAQIRFQLLFKISPDFAVKLLGGASLMVLAR